MIKNRSDQGSGTAVGIAKTGVEWHRLWHRLVRVRLGWVRARLGKTRAHGHCGSGGDGEKKVK